MRMWSKRVCRKIWEKWKKTRGQQSCRENLCAGWTPGLTAAVGEAGDRGDRACSFCVSVFPSLDPVNASPSSAASWWPCWRGACGTWAAMSSDRYGGSLAQHVPCWGAGVLLLGPEASRSLWTPWHFHKLSLETHAEMCYIFKIMDCSLKK